MRREMPDAQETVDKEKTRRKCIAWWGKRRMRPEVTHERGSASLLTGFFRERSWGGV